MIKSLQTLVLLAAVMAGVTAHAADFGTSEEAVAMVKKAVTFLDKNGEEKAIAAFNEPTGQFVDRDLYIVVHDMQGKVLANSALPRMVGKNIIDLKDTDGKAFIRERIRMLSTASNGWIDFKWPNSVSKTIEARSVYFEKDKNLVLTCGVRKK